MEFRRGVSLVVYRKEKDKTLYLVLKRRLRWIGYELIKCGKFKGESDIQIIKRELREETSLKPKKIINLNYTTKFIYPKKHQSVWNKKGFVGKCYAIEAKGKIKLNKEHSSYKWLTFKKAIKIITFKEAKKILRIANKKLR